MVSSGQSFGRFDSKATEFCHRKVGFCKLGAASVRRLHVRPHVELQAFSTPVHDQSEHEVRWWDLTCLPISKSHFARVSLSYYSFTLQRGEVHQEVTLPICGTGDSGDLIVREHLTPPTATFRRQHTLEETVRLERKAVVGTHCWGLPAGLRIGG